MASHRPSLSLDRMPDDPTQEEIAARCHKVRFAGFTDSNGDWCEPWTEEMTMRRREVAPGHWRRRPVSEVGGIREVSRYFYWN